MDSGNRSNNWSLPEELLAYVPRMRFRVLGTLVAEPDGKPAALGGPKQRALFAMLVAAGGDAVSVDSLIDGVWGDHPPKAVTSSVHTYVSNLRAATGAEIERTGSAYRLVVGPDEIDWKVFEQLLDEGRRTLPTNASKAGETLRLALSLWRGRPYADLNGAPGLDPEIRRLEELRLAAVEARIDADLASGRHHAVIGELETLTAEHPLHEGFRARHMLALYRDGRQAEALRVYQATRSILGDELGVEPSPDLQNLEERILTHDPDLVAPSGTVTQSIAFLFTDVEDSTALWETRPEAMREALAHHDEILAKAIDQAGGRIFKHTGDGVLAAFTDAVDAARAAVQAQRDLLSTEWGAVGRIAVRMGIDVGEVESRGGDFFGPPLNRAARFMTAAHGGQIVLTEAAQQALRHEAGVKLLNLGEHRFKGLGAPHEAYQLVADGLPESFPPLRTDAPVVEAGRQFGDAIRGYELRERIGAGRFGVVYRAYQPAVGREVAVKVIRPEFANHPEFVRRFEGEARLVAKLEHPHIVSLYDFWRDHEGAYLVMPFLVGRSLAGNPFGAMSLDRALPILRQVGSGLAYAHRQGVIHRDIKPANLLLDGDGNAYLADFGVAIRAVERASGIQPTSQLYRAPEDRDGEALDARTDVYSFGAVAIELLAGQPPGSEALAALPDDVAQVLAAATAEDMSQRPGSVEEFLTRLERVAGAEVQETAPRPVFIRNPYKGLAAFDTSDAQDFFGREREIEELAGLVFENRFVTVVGPSGSGKSSLVRAGLIPALARDAIAGSSGWLSITMVPGAFPFDELAPALAEVATEPMGDIAAELRADPHGLLRIIKRLTHAIEGELLLVVDQFEELYTLVRSEDARRAFIAALCGATDDPHSRLRVVTTIRADFFDRPLADDQLASRVVSAHLAIGVPDAERLVEIIEGPAHGAGIWLEPGLSAQITGDVRDQPGALPLLEFVLSDLVAASDDGHVTVEAYRRRGGVLGAIGRRADEVYLGLGDHGPVAEQVFLRLVNVNTEADDVRRRVRRRELEGLGFDRSALDAVLEAFGSARLLTFDRDPVTRGPTVEVAHEAILREWPRLRDWVEDRRESLLVQRRLAQAREAWEESGRSDDELPGGARLAQFEAWLDDPLVNATAEEHEFVTTAVEHRDRLARERARRRRQITTGFGVAALVAVVLAAVAWLQRGETAREAALATARSLVLEADRVVDDDPDLAIALAVEAVEAFQRVGDTVPAAAVSAVRSAIANNKVVFRVPGGRFVAVDPTGSLLATADDRDVAVWDIESRTVVDGYRHESDTAVAESAAFSPDGAYLAVSYTGVDQQVRVWNRETGTFWEFGEPVVGPWRNPGLSFDPAGENLAFDRPFQPGDPSQSTLEVWSTVTGRQVLEDDGGWLPTFYRDGTLVYIWCAPPANTACEARIRSPKGLQVRETIPVPVGVDPLWARFSPDQRWVVLGGQGAAVVYDTVTMEEVSRTTVDRLGEPVWLPTADAFVAGGESDLRVFDAATGAVIRDLVGLEGGSWSYAVFDGGKKLAAASLGGSETVIFGLDLGTTAEVAGWRAPVSNVWSVYFNGSGSHVVSSVPDPNALHTGDLFSGTTLLALDGGEGNWFPWANNTADYITFFGDDHRWSVRRTDTGAVIHRAEPPWEIHGVSTDGTMALETNPEDDSSRLVFTFADRDPVDLDIGYVAQVNFSADGRLVAVADRDEGTIEVFASMDGMKVASIPASVVPFSLSPAISPDSKRLVVSGFGPVYVFDLEALLSGVSADQALERQIAAHENLILKTKISPDSTMLMTAAWSERLKVWDLEDGSLLGEFGSEFDGRAIHDGAFHPTGPWLVVSTPPNEIRVHTLDIDELVDIARSRLTREMTEEECQQYLRRACDA